MLVSNLIKKYDGTFKALFDPQPDDSLATVGAEITYQLSGVSTQIISLMSFEDTISGLTTTRTVERYYSFSTDNINFSSWTLIGDFSEFVDLDGEMPFYLKLKYKRTGTDTTGLITIQDATFHGEWLIPQSYIIVELNSIDECQKLLNPDTLKVFKLTDFNVYSTGVTATRQLEIRFRFSQNSGRTWSNWELLKMENLSTIKVDPLKFFKIEYSACRRGTDTTGTIKLLDIELTGDFQNVSDNYKKTNRYGIRSCCDPTQLNVGGGFGSLNPDGTLSLNSTPQQSAIPEDLLNALCTGSNFNPYQLGSATELYNYLANGVVKSLGWEATYWKTSTDEKGIDREFHEYQLYNVCGMSNIKVMVPENAFPDNQITFNQFDLSLFEAFEIHITKDEFKKAFGIENRPEKEDFLFLCVTNRMYQVEHAQAYRDFLNSSIYYKVILKKYNNKANVRHLSQDTKNALEVLTNNSSLDALFGESNTAEDKRLDKEQLNPLSFDVARKTINASTVIIRNELVNASLLVSDYQYNLSRVLDTVVAVDYNKADGAVLKSDNRSFLSWFKLNNNEPNKKYVILDNYDSLTQKGYKIWFENDQLSFTFNAVQYDLPTPGISEKIWYVPVISFNQRLNYVEMEIYQRDTQIDVDSGEEIGADLLNSSELLKLWSQVWENVAVDEFSQNDLTMKIYGSDMQLTNIRVFTDVIPKSTYKKVLNQKLVKSSDFLVLADNAEEKIIVTNHS